jgi:hypothetical protein
MVDARTRPQDWPMTNLPSSVDERPGPSLPTILIGGAAILVGLMVVAAVVVPAIFSLLALAIPAVLLVVGVRQISKGNAATPLARILGWAAAILGGWWLIEAIDLGRIVLVGLLVAAAIFVGKRVMGRRPA